MLSIKLYTIQKRKGVKRIKMRNEITKLKRKILVLLYTEKCIPASQIPLYCEYLERVKQIKASPTYLYRILRELTAMNYIERIKMGYQQKGIAIESYEHESGYKIKNIYRLTQKGKRYVEEQEEILLGKEKISEACAEIKKENDEVLPTYATLEERKEKMIEEGFKANSLDGEAEYNSGTVFDGETDTLSEASADKKQTEQTEQAPTARLTLRTAIENERTVRLIKAELFGKVSEARYTCEATTACEANEACKATTVCETTTACKANKTCTPKRADQIKFRTNDEMRTGIKNKGTYSSKAMGVVEILTTTSPPKIMPIYNLGGSVSSQSKKTERKMKAEIENKYDTKIDEEIILGENYETLVQNLKAKIMRKRAKKKSRENNQGSKYQRRAKSLLIDKDQSHPTTKYYHTLNTNGVSKMEIHFIPKEIRKMYYQELLKHDKRTERYFTAESIEAAKYSTIYSSVTESENIYIGYEENINELVSLIEQTFDNKTDKKELVIICQENQKELYEKIFKTGTFKIEKTEKAEKTEENKVEIITTEYYK